MRQSEQVMRGSERRMWTRAEASLPGRGLRERKQEISPRLLRQKKKELSEMAWKNVGKLANLGGGGAMHFMSQRSPSCIRLVSGFACHVLWPPATPKKWL